MKIIVLKIKCSHCGTANRVVLPSKGNMPANCGNCRSRLFDYQVFSGLIYVLSNESMPGLVKIGQTSKGIKQRVKDLSGSTGVPTPFSINAVFASQDPQTDERIIHTSLASHRTPGREFFRISPDHAAIAIQDILGRSPIFDAEEHGAFDDFRIDLD